MYRDYLPQQHRAIVTCASECAAIGAEDDAFDRGCMATEYLCLATGGYIQHNALIEISDCEGIGIGTENDAIHANIACEYLYVFSGGNIPQPDGFVGHSVASVSTTR